MQKALILRRFVAFLLALVFVGICAACLPAGPQSPTTETATDISTSETPTQTDIPDINIPTTEPVDTTPEESLETESETDTEETTEAETFETGPDGETRTAFDKDAVSASIEAIYPTDYATTESSYTGYAGLTAHDYNGRLVRTLSEEDLIQIDEVIDEFITKDMTRTEKVLVIHDWIIENVDYDFEFNAQTIHTALNNGLTVCNGYADLFMVFMMECGIPADYALGYSRNVYHMWNMVQLEDGFWYYIDVTWDDPSSVWEDRNKDHDYILHDYFLLTREEFDRDHENTSKHTPTPLATLPAEEETESETESK